MVARHAISGQALVRSYVSNTEYIHGLVRIICSVLTKTWPLPSDNPMLSDPKIAEVVISILSERGYAVTMDERIHETPKRVDPQTWDIILERTHVFALNVRFPQHHIQPLEQKF